MNTIINIHPMKGSLINTNKLTTILPLLVILIFTQCRKDPRLYFCDRYPSQCIATSHIKDHYYFKTGSWWVYDEINTHQRDSQWVDYDWLSDNNRQFDMVIKSTLDDYERHRWTHLLTQAKTNSVIPKKKLAYIERSKSKAGDFVGTSFMGIFYPVVGDSLNNFGGGGSSSATYYSQLRIKDILPTYTQLNYTFNNVIVIADDYNMIEHSQPTIHYYAEGVGLIRKELIDSNQIWVMSDYHVEQ